MKVAFLTFHFSFFIFNLLFSQSPDSWTRKADFPGAARQDAAAFAAGNKGYVVTGKDSSGTLLAEVWQYDPSSDSWTQLNDFPGIARCGAAAFSVNDTGYVLCGYDGTNELKDCWRYDNGTDSWTRMQDLGTSLSGSFPGRSHATGMGTGNYGYLFSGYDGSSSYLKQSLRFDPMNDTNWAVVRNLGNVSDLTLFGRRWGAGFVLGNTPYYGTGFTFSQDIRKDLWRFDAPLNAWVQVADLPDIRSNAIGFSLFGKGYIGCGTNGTSQQDLWRYSPADNAWTRVADLPGGARVNASCFVIGGRAYVSGGQHTAGNVYGDLWEYTPDSTVSVGEPSIPELFLFQRNGQLVLTCPTNALDGALFELHAIDGRLVRAATITGAEALVPILDLPAATYLYRITGQADRWRKSGKVVVD